MSEEKKGALARLLKSGALARTLGPEPKKSAVEELAKEELAKILKALDEVTYYAPSAGTMSAPYGSTSVPTMGSFSIETPSSPSWTVTIDDTLPAQPAAPPEPASAELKEKCEKLEAERDKALTAHKQLWRFIEEAGLLAEAVRWCELHDVPVTT